MDTVVRARVLRRLRIITVSRGFGRMELLMWMAHSIALVGWHGRITNSVPAFWMRIKLAGTGFPCNSTMVGHSCFSSFVRKVEEFQLHPAAHSSKPQELQDICINQILQSRSWMNGAAHIRRDSIQPPGRS